MKLVEVTCIKIHTSKGKKVRGDVFELPLKEYETLVRVRPGTLKILGDAPVKKPAKKKAKAQYGVITN